MRLSTKSEYAFLALIDLAENYNRGLVKIGEISKRKRIPKKYLEQILLLLKRTGYVKSKRGADGGYKLAKNPGEICIAEIVRLMDGPLAPVACVSRYFYEKTPIEQNKQLTSLLREIRDYIATKLEKTTFADIIKK